MKPSSILCAQIFRRMDPQQRESRGVRYTAQGSQDVGNVHREHHRHPGDIQTHFGTVHGHVPAQGFLALVHGRGHGRDGVHRSRVQHERSGVRVPAVPGICYDVRAPVVTAAGSNIFLFMAPVIVF